MTLPVLGRLSVVEWGFVVVSIVFTWLEYISTTITRLLPRGLIRFLSYALNVAYRFSSTPINFITQRDASDAGGNDAVSFKYVSNSAGISLERHRLMTRMLNSRNIQEMCQVHGYDVENRLVRTQDGYLLTMHRLTRCNGPPAPRNGRVVYLHHGLLMSAEVWVSMLERNQNLPFVLYERGYDVWLGNNRGSKYSHKHINRKLDLAEFWDFCIDDFAMFDIPATIDAILSDTGAPCLTYIGFSQGAAQVFALVSINPQLNSKIDRIIGISPATTPHGLYSRFLDILLKSSPNLIYLLFSRGVLIPSTVFWERVMYPPFFDSSVDLSIYMLFNWRSTNIDKIQKVASYAHMYSTTSVKVVVHWFQIMASKTFQMYHDASTAVSNLNPVCYPLQNIRIPISLIYGDKDLLVDIDVMLKQLPSTNVQSHCVAGHEHLDNLWGRDVEQTVIPLVLSALVATHGADVDGAVGGATGTVALTQALSTTHTTNSPDNGTTNGTKTKNHLADAANNAETINHSP